jgi:hypothetical protein
MNINFIIKHIHPDLFPEYDPRNPPRTVPDCPTDDIHPDVQEIIEKLLSIKTDGDLKELCWQLFGEHFSNEIADTCGGSEYENVEFDIWKTCCR